METWKLPHTTLTGEIRGDGPPVMFLPGLRHPRSMWDGVLANLTTPVRSITVDWPGQGTSPPAPSELELKLAHLAEDVAALIDRLGLGPVGLAGFSLGGMVALPVAIGDVDAKRVDSLVLIGTSADPEGWFQRYGEYPAMISLVKLLGWQALTGGVMKLLRKDLPRLFNSPAYLSQPGNREALCRMVIECGPVKDAALAKAIVGRAGHSDDELGRITARTLVVRGAEDDIRHESESVRMTEKIAKAEPLFRIAGSGHCVCAEAPVEAARALSAFWAKLNPRPADRA